MTTKIITNLLNKATTTGYANVNGRMHYEYGLQGELESKYSATIDNDVLTFTHWGTKTLELDLKGASTIIEFYGESVSDRDALNGVLEFFGLTSLGRFHFYPSMNKFTLEEN